MLQGGDCAEAFADFHADKIRDSLRVLLQMAVVLTFGAGMPVVKMGRIAGQFAKPRSADMEEIGGSQLPSYRGDIVNGIEFEPGARRPDPARQLQAYSQAAATLNLLRAFTQGGYASLTRVHQWTLGFLDRSPQGERYRDMAHRITEALEFMQACGVTDLTTPEINRTTPLHLARGPAAGLRAGDDPDRIPPPAAGTTPPPISSGSATAPASSTGRMSSSAAASPTRSGVKAGPSMPVEDLLRLCDVLNPDNEPGRLTVISRMGHDKVERHLPPLVRALQREGRAVVWSCDPMHGNTIKSTSGYKTRPFDRILAEVAQLLRRPQGRGHPRRRHPCRDDRPGRHRMHRRRPGDHRRRPAGPLPHLLRPPPQRPAEPGAGLPDGRGAEGGAAGAAGGELSLK